MEEENGLEQNGNENILPLWKRCLEAMEKHEEFGFNCSWPVEFFEKVLNIDRTKEPNAFAFAMLDVREGLKWKHGLYLSSEQYGKLWRIPSAVDHNVIVAARKDRDVVKCASAAVYWRARLLDNPDADLNDKERDRCEREMEKAQMRLMLLCRKRGLDNGGADAINKLQ